MRLTPVIVLLVLTPALPIPVLASPPPRRHPPHQRVAGLVDIGGRKLYLECHGTGSPTVVLVAGYAPPAATGRRSAPAGCAADDGDAGVAETTRVCTYDRPGTHATSVMTLLSRSDPIAQPRTAPEVVAELHALLQAAEIPGPYVLAGHSLGGFIARLYAATYPDEVIGLVLVDAYSELLENVMSPEQWQALVRLNQEMGSDTVFPIPGYGDAETIGYGADNAVMREAVAASPLPPMPLAVLAHGKPFAQPAETHRGSAPGSWKRYLRGE